MNSTCVVPANSRGERILLNEGYRFVRKSKSKSAIRWICTGTGCCAFVYTNIFDVHDDDAHITGMLHCELLLRRLIVWFSNNKMSAP